MRQLVEVFAVVACVLMAAVTARAEGEAEKKPLTEEECLAFAESVQQAVLEQDVEAFNALIDWDGIVYEATSGFKDSPGMRARRMLFRQGFKDEMEKTGGLCGQIIEAVKQGGSYRLLRVHGDGDDRRVLFRLLLPGGGVNYHDYMLKRRPDGSLQAADQYVFLSGERLSETLRRGFVPVAFGELKGEAEEGQPEGWEQDYVRSLSSIEKLIRQMRNGRYREALEVYEQLPETVQKEKSILIFRLQAAQQVGDEEYTAAIDAFRTHYPDDACIDLIAIDGHALKQEFAEALACLERVDRAVGGDPYMDVMRANLSLSQEKFEDARESARRAIQQEPDLLDAYWTLITTSLAEQKHDETLELLQTVGERFDLTFNDLTAVPAYAEFVKSPQYQTWLESRKADAE